MRDRKSKGRAGRASVLAAALVVTWAWGCNPKSPEQTEEKPSGEVAAPEAKAQVEAPPEPKLPDPLPSLEGPHHPAYDLLANRPHAHRLDVGAARPTVVVDAGSLDFVRYIHGNHPGEWSTGVEVEGRAVSALRKRRDGSLWVPAPPEGVDVVQMRVFNPARATSELTLRLNGESVGEKSLEPGWHTVSFEVKPGAARVENELRLSFSNLGRIDGDLSGGALAWLRIGAPLAMPGAASKAPADDARAAEVPDAAPAGGREAQDDGASEIASAVAAPRAVVDEAEVNAEVEARTMASLVGIPTAQGPLALEHSAAAFWHVWGLEGSKLRLSLAGEPGCGVRVHAAVEGEGGALKTAFEEERLLVEGHGEEQPTFIDLAPIAGKVARVSLRQSGTCPTPPTLQRADIVLPGEAPVVPKVKPPKYVIFWMIDTLRSDHLPIHFDTNVEAPNLKRLADEGASFAVAYTQGNESKVSHASLFSGMFPSKHRVLVRGHLKPHHHILPEAIKDAGYKTGAYISNGYISEPWGFVQGWDHYLNNLRSNYRIDGASMAEMGAKWAKENKESPFFLYLGTIDPHVTYRKHDELIGKYDPEPYNGRFGRSCLGTELGEIKGGKIRVDDRDKLRIQNLYKNEITFNDQAFGALRAALEAEGMWEETMVVVTADHGDEFWEHGSVGHGHSVHQELVHVPLLVYYPPLIPAGTAVEAGADVADVYPTIVDAIGQERPEGLQGKSLLPLIHRVRGDYPEPAVATQYLLHYGMQKQNWKLYVKKGAYELYDRTADPLEKSDVASAHPLASRWLMDSFGWFRAYRDSWDKESFGAASNLAPDFLAKLRGTSE